MIRDVERCRHCGSIDTHGLSVSEARGEIIVGSSACHVTPGQMRVIAALAAAGGALVRKETLIMGLYGDRPDGGPDWADNMLKIQVCRLRRALTAIRAPVRIANVFGVGYRLEPIEQPAETPCPENPGAAACPA